MRTELALISNRLDNNHELLDIAHVLMLCQKGYSPWYWDIESNQFSLSPEILARMSAGTNLNHANGLLDAIHEEDIEMGMREIYKYLEGVTDSLLVNLRMRCGHGGYGTLEWRGYITDRDQNGKPIRVLGSHLCIA